MKQGWNKRLVKTIFYFLLFIGWGVSLVFFTDFMAVLTAILLLCIVLFAFIGAVVVPYIKGEE